MDKVEGVWVHCTVIQSIVTMFTKLQKHYSAQKYPRRLHQDNSLFKICSDNTISPTQVTIPCESIDMFVPYKLSWSFPWSFSLSVCVKVPSDWLTKLSKMKGKSPSQFNVGKQGLNRANR